MAYSLDSPQPIEPDMTHLPLPDSAAVHPADARHHGTVAGDTRLEVTLVLAPIAPGDDLAAKQTLIDRLAPLSRPVLSDEEVARLHDAEAADLAAVGRFAAAHQLDLVPSWAGASGRDVVLSGTAAAFATAFRTTLGHVGTARGTHIAPTGPVNLPTELAGVVVAVHGLDGTPHASPLARLAASGPAVDPRELVRDRYGAPVDTLDGTGERIAIIAFGGGYWPEDLVEYFDAVLPGRPHPLVTPVSVPKAPGGSGPVNRPTPRRALARLVDDLDNLPLMADVEGGMDCGMCSERFLATLETTMDIELAGAIAPGAAIDVYFAGNDMAGYVAAIETAIGLRPGGPGKATIISISWGKGEAWFSGNAKNVITIALEKARDHGVTVVAASGDLGAVGVEPGSGYEHRANVSFPASSQWVLGCGGTTIVSGRELAWNGTWKGVPMASGGGVSGFCEAVAWQAECDVPQGVLRDGRSWRADGVADGFTGRGVPDVAANADPDSGYALRLGGRDTIGGGTSAAAPVWAGLLALTNQAITARAAQLGRPTPVRLGYANHLFYRPELRPAFDEVTEGHNRLPDADPKAASYRAGPGWNPCTGLGTPRTDQLIALVTSEEPLL
jgi:kumamolisin